MTIAIYPDQVELPWGPGRDLQDGRWAYVAPLLYGGRICLMQAGDLAGYTDGY